MRKTYQELIQLESFDDRLDYLRMNGTVGNITFGGHRSLNQILYQTPQWKSTRRKVILRDNGCDLAHEDHPIGGPIYIHHINPITIDDILKDRPCVFDLNNLISTTFRTHNAIHYGLKAQTPSGLVVRSKNDTCPWK